MVVESLPSPLFLYGSGYTWVLAHVAHVVPWSYFSEADAEIGLMQFTSKAMYVLNQ